ncbi:MAG TPA: TIGR03067 domain-containing protein [Puia sp.]|nr:TIGR03067 domain-containing protein [Puia sp.]
MKLLTFFLFFCLFLACNTPKKASTGTPNFNGTWIPVKQEMGGTALPNSIFEKEKLILADSTYTLIAESTDKGIVKYNGNKMDIYGREGVNAGKHFTAIYKFENDQLIVCYNLSGDSYPESFDTKANKMLFLSAFKKSP